MNSHLSLSLRTYKRQLLVKDLIARKNSECFKSRVLRSKNTLQRTRNPLADTRAFTLLQVPAERLSVISESISRTDDNPNDP